MATHSNILAWKIPRTEEPSGLQSKGSQFSSVHLLSRVWLFATLAWGGQSTGVSALASFLPKNTQDWSPLEWTGWISLQSKGLQDSQSVTIEQLSTRLWVVRFQPTFSTHVAPLLCSLTPPQQYWPPFTFFHCWAFEQAVSCVWMFLSPIVCLAFSSSNHWLKDIFLIHLL